MMLADSGLTGSCKTGASFVNRSFWSLISATISGGAVETSFESSAKCRNS